jgi:hypothetical protein
MAKLNLGKTELSLLARLESPLTRKIGFMGVDGRRDMNAARALVDRGLIDIHVIRDWAYRRRGSGKYLYSTRETFYSYRVSPGTGKVSWCKNR